MKPDWQWRWYGAAFGPGQVKIAIVWNDRAVPHVTINGETLVLTSGSAEAALQQYASSVDELITVGKPPG